VEAVTVGRVAVASLLTLVACAPPPAEPPRPPVVRPVPSVSSSASAPPPEPKGQALEERKRTLADPRYGRGIDIVAESHLPEYVRGFPMHMAITIETIHGETIGVNGAGLPVVSLYRALGVQVAFTSASSGATHRFGKYVPPGGSIDPPCAEPYFPFPERPMRLLFDAAMVADVRALESGRHTVEIVYDKAPAPPFEIVLRDATAAERQELASIAAYLRARHDAEDEWTSWVLWGRAPARPPRMSKTDPLRYFKVLRYLNTTPTAPEAIEPHVMDALDGFYAPEAEVLRADLARLRHDDTAFKRHADTIRVSFPAIVEDLEAIEKGGSEIKTRRETASRYGTRIPAR
jgi:hypothetical protein